MGWKTGVGTIHACCGASQFLARAHSSSIGRQFPHLTIPSPALSIPVGSMSVSGRFSVGFMSVLVVFGRFYVGFGRFFTLQKGAAKTTTL
jgi:hypothetical protein